MPKFIVYYRAPYVAGGRHLYMWSDDGPAQIAKDMGYSPLWTGDAADKDEAIRHAIAARGGSEIW